MESAELIGASDECGCVSQELDVKRICSCMAMQVIFFPSQPGHSDPGVTRRILDFMLFMNSKVLFRQVLNQALPGLRCNCTELLSASPCHHEHSQRRCCDTIALLLRSRKQIFMHHMLTWSASAGAA